MRDDAHRPGRTRRTRTGLYAASLGILSRAPAPGRVKTRLVPLLGELAAARFHHACLVDSYDRLRRAGFSPLLFMTPGPAGRGSTRSLGWSSRRYSGCPEEDEALLRDALLRGDVRGQLRGGFGRRIAGAIDALLALPRARAAILIGSDSPDIPTSTLAAAADRLLDAPIVFAPALDGGFVLIGLAAGACPTRGRLPWLLDLLSGVPWSTEDTLSALLGRCAELGLEPGILGSWPDVDRDQDLFDLRDRLRHAEGGDVPRRVFAFMEELGLLPGSVARSASPIPRHMAPSPRAGCHRSGEPRSVPA